MDDETRLEAIRKDYAGALLENQKAKEQYALLLNKKTAEEAIQHDNEIRDPLDTHLEVLRLRKQHQQLQSLSHYIDEADTIAKNAGIFELHPKPSNVLEDPSEIANDGQLASMLEEAKALTQKLEIALLQARYQLKRERALLESVETQRKENNPAPPSNAAKLRALLATRAELTNWIESTLAKCDASVLTSETPEPSSKDQSLEAIQKEIDHQYERYVTARKRAVVAQQVLNRPLPTTTETSRSSQPRRPVSPIRKQSQPHSQKSTKQSKSTNHLDASLANIEANYLPLQTHQTLLETYTAYLLTQLTQSKTQLTETLHRLSDESHLLPSYPLLANSSRFQNARAALSKPYPRPPMESGSRDPFVEAGEGSGTAAETATEEITQFLQAWSFASEAAATNTNETVASHVGQGQAALEQAEEHLQGMQEMELAWEELAKIDRPRKP